MAEADIPEPMEMQEEDQERSPMHFLLVLLGREFTILQYIIENDAYHRLRGNGIWREMYRELNLGDSWKHWKRHFRRVMMKDICSPANLYELTPEEVEKFAAVYPRVYHYEHIAEQVPDNNVEFFAIEDNVQVVPVDNIEFFNIEDNVQEVPVNNIEFFNIEDNVQEVPVDNIEFFNIEDNVQEVPVDNIELFNIEDNVEGVAVNHIEFYTIEGVPFDNIELFAMEHNVEEVPANNIGLLAIGDIVEVPLDNIELYTIEEWIQGENGLVLSGLYTIYEDEERSPDNI